MKQKKMKFIDIEKERINISLTTKNYEELKIILLNRSRCQIKINERMHLSGPKLFKHLMIIGLEVLQRENKEIKEIFLREGLINEK